MQQRRPNTAYIYIYIYTHIYIYIYIYIHTHTHIHWSNAWNPLTLYVQSRVSGIVKKNVVLLLCFSFTLTLPPHHNTSDTRCVGLFPHHAILWHKLGVLQYNSVLTVLSGDGYLCFWPTCYRSEVPTNPPWVWLICSSVSQDSGKQFTYCLPVYCKRMW